MPDFYQDLKYPNPPEDRPYVVINMVTTIDGKIVTGERGEPVHDLGSEVDHTMMRHIQASVDAILIGATNQRTTPKLWYPADKIRIVVTRSGDVLYPSRFFDDAPEKAIVFCTDSSKLPDLPGMTRVFRLGENAVDWERAIRLLKELGITKLLVEGGSEVNAQLLGLQLVDELFLTIAPKIKLGEDTPTYADGKALSKEAVQHYQLLEHHIHNNEVFLRFRRK
jgi:riboflavin-specific deaminase-like protein